MIDTDTDFVDYYETLESSCNASFETIERTFRFLAKRFHPDAAENGDPARFTEIVQAYETLRDPEKRAEYDTLRKTQLTEQNAIMREAGHATSDTRDRHRLLSLFYAQRRRDYKNPGIGSTTLEEIMGLSAEVLEFHLWFFREKGWINREDSGTLSISAAGVDKIEATVEKQEERATMMRITAASSSD